MATLYSSYSRPVSYGRDPYSNMSSNYTKKPFTHVSSSGYGQTSYTSSRRVSSPASRTRSYSMDRIGSGGSNGRVTGLVTDYNSKVFGKSGATYMNGGSSTVSHRPPSGRKLPAGPGLHDERGQKMDIQDAIHNAQRKTRKSDYGTGPVKATYTPSTYNSNKSTSSRDYEYSSRTLRDIDRLSLNDSPGTSTSSLMRSRKYGSTSSLKSNSTERMYEDTYPLNKKSTTTTATVRLNKNDPLPHINTTSQNGHLDNDLDEVNHNRSPDSYTSRRKAETRTDNSEDYSSHRKRETRNDNDDFRNRHSSPESTRGKGERGSSDRTVAKADHGLTGLGNLGNTCFMNTMIQCLSNIRPIMEYFTSSKYREHLNSASKMRGDLAESFGSLLCEIWSGSKVTKSYYSSSLVRPSSFKSLVGKMNSRFRNTDQHDAQEFLILFLEGLSADVNRVKEKRKKQPLDDKWDKTSAREKAVATWEWYLSYEDSYLMEQLVGQMQSTLVCGDCRGESHTFDNFWDISLPVKRAYRASIKLEDCIEAFFHKETLNGVRCERCKSHVTCRKHLSIWRCPRILILQLKRFEHSGLKVNSNVDYPIKDLDLSDYVANTEGGLRPVYNLIGVACHSGTPSFGHYIAYAKHPYSGVWHKYDDSSVTEASTRSCVTSSAYVLFYERSDSQLSRL